MSSLTPGIRISPCGETSLDTGPYISNEVGRKSRLRTDGDQIRHGLVDRPAEHSRVEISPWSRDPNLIVVDPSEPVRQARGLGVEPVVVCRVSAG